MTKVEQVARAIAPYAWNDSFWQEPGRRNQYDRNQRHVQRTAMREARAAIEAMREPSPEMTAAFDRACDEHGHCMMRYGWRAMIDAALTEGQEG